MDELDARLRAMAKGEDWTLPPAYETAMDGLEEQVRRGTLPRRGKRRLGRRMLLLAAAAAVLLAATAVSMDFWHVQLGEISVGDEESSYDVEADLPGIPIEAFSEQVENALAEIRQAFEERQQAIRDRDYAILASGHFAGSWTKDMDTWAECEKFLEFQVANPLEEHRDMEPRSLKVPGELSKPPYELSLLGNEKGEMEQISITALYEYGEAGVSFAVIFLPEGRESSQLTTGSVWKGEVDFETAEAQTGSGMPVSIVIPTVEESDYYSDFSSMEAYFVLNSGLYMLRVNIPGADREGAAEALLDELLALF